LLHNRGYSVNFTNVEQKNGMMLKPLSGLKNWTSKEHLTQMQNANELTYLIQIIAFYVITRMLS
jgi:hypothetical protein